VHDYIVIGAGSAGCALAARLSEDLRNRVLLLEAGPLDKKQEIRVPAAFSKLFHTDLDWDYLTEPEPQTGNRPRYWPRGKVLGGSSSLNAMMYVRGHTTDYDQWRQLGNVGWGFEDVLPYFKKSEAFSGDGGEQRFHGTNGPLHVSSQRSPNALTETFIAAGQHVGLKRVDDINGQTQDGIGLTHVTQHNGRRWSAADAFLKPAMKRPNLTVQTDCLVHKIGFVNNKATTVSYARGGASTVEPAAK
jgi:choline dehydrogenase